MPELNGFDGFAEFRGQASGYFAVCIDDGKVAYAYLHDPEEEIVGDVWLYNRCPAPSELEWKDPDRLPFANLAAYIRDEELFPPVENASEMQVQWGYTGHGAVEAKIYIRDRLHAILAEGEKPGCCILAGKDGPLAKVIR